MKKLLGAISLRFTLAPTLEALCAKPRGEDELKKKKSRGAGKIMCVYSL